MVTPVNKEPALVCDEARLGGGCVAVVMKVNGLVAQAAKQVVREASLTGLGDCV